MKKYVKLGLAAVGFVAFLAVVSLLYNRLSEDYKPGQSLVVENGAGAQTDETDNGAGNADGADVSGSAESEENVNDAGASANEAGGTVNNDTNNHANDNTGDANDNSSEDNTSEEQQANLAIDFTMENAAGEAVSLFDFVGKPIVLNFWASWCGPCKAEIPDFQTAYEKYDGEIEFLMVNMTDGAQETKESAMTFIEEQGYILPFYFDTQLQGAYTYGVYSLPTTFFINAEGEMVAYAQGMIDGETLEQGISMIYDEN